MNVMPLSGVYALLNSEGATCTLCAVSGRKHHCLRCTPRSTAASSAASTTDQTIRHMRYRQETQEKDDAQSPHGVAHNLSKEDEHLHLDRRCRPRVGHVTIPTHARRVHPVRGANQQRQRGRLRKTMPRGQASNKFFQRRRQVEYM